MNISIKKAVSLLVVFTTIFVFLAPRYANASEKVPIDDVSHMTTARTNLTFLVGQVGDPYLVYTYEEQGKTYKVIDETFENGAIVKSQIFEQQKNGNFTKIRDQKLEVLPSGDITFDMDNGGKITTELVYDASAEMVPSAISPFGYGEWTTLETNGSSTFKNKTIAAIATILVAIITRGCSLIINIAASLLSNEATEYFKADASKAYYHKTYSWKTREDNVLVISGEAVHVQYFYDAAHDHYVGEYYKEYIE